MHRVKLSISTPESDDEENGVITMDEDGNWQGNCSMTARPIPERRIHTCNADGVAASSALAPSPSIRPCLSSSFPERTSSAPAPPRSFNSKAAKLAHYASQLTEICEYLYVSGAKVAASEEKLIEKGITHIINCAGDVCANYFPHRFHYLKLHLLDSASEDIMCVLYKVIDYIDVVRKEKKKVLVHCQQGVSRSTILVIAYLMYLQNSDYDVIYDYVRSRRGICRPNVGFMCQLLAWRKRVTRGASHRPHCMYRIGPHNARDRSLVTKWVDRVEAESLDSRTLFLLQTMPKVQENNGDEDDKMTDTTSSNSTHSSASSASSSASASTASSSSSSPSNDCPLYIWVGCLCPPAHEKAYIPYLAHLIAKIQQVEHAGKHVRVIRQRGRTRISRAEAAIKAIQGAKSPLLPPTSQSQSSPSSSPNESTFSSEHISASFHTLDTASLALSASSLSSLYPSASSREVSAFYRTLGMEERDGVVDVPECYCPPQHSSRSSSKSSTASNSTHTTPNSSPSPSPSSSSLPFCTSIRQPISSAILINPSMDDDYADVHVPNVRAINEAIIRGGYAPCPHHQEKGPNGTTHSSGNHQAGGGIPNGASLLLPPIIRTGPAVRRMSIDDEFPSVPTSAPATTTAHCSAAIPPTPCPASVTVPPTPLAVPNSNEQNLRSPGPVGPSMPPTPAQNRFTSAASNLSTPTAAAAGGAAPCPKLPLNLFVSTPADDASPGRIPILSCSNAASAAAASASAAADSLSVAVTPVDPHLHPSSASPATSARSGASSTPASTMPSARTDADGDTQMGVVVGVGGGGGNYHVRMPASLPVSARSISSSRSTASAPSSRGPILSPRRLPMPSIASPTTPLVFSPSHAASTTASVPPTPQAATPVHAHTHASSDGTPPTPTPTVIPPPLLFEFPQFNRGSFTTYTRSTLRSPSIFLLYSAALSHLWVWLPRPGQLFIPSKYEGDRAAFAQDIGRIFGAQCETGRVDTISIEVDGKESSQFCQAFDSGAAAAAADGEVTTNPDAQ